MSKKLNENSKVPTLDPSRCKWKICESTEDEEDVSRFKSKNKAV